MIDEIVKDLCVNVTGEISLDSLKYSDLQGLEQGDTMDLKLKQNTVNLAVDGQVFAKGQFVQINGKLAIEIVDVN